MPGKLGLPTGALREGRDQMGKLRLRGLNDPPVARMWWGEGCPCILSPPDAGDPRPLWSRPQTGPLRTRNLFRSMLLSAKSSFQALWASWMWLRVGRAFLSVLRSASPCSRRNMASVSSFCFFSCSVTARRRQGLQAPARLARG